MKKFIIVIMLLLLIPLNVKSASLSGECIIVMEQNSNRIMYAKNIHKVRSVASISKVMTAILAIESGKLNDKVIVGEEILKAYGSAVYIKVGESITLEELVYGLMLRSGNDAALAIAKYVGGSVEKFITMMNTKANELGMDNTTFNNPSGLDEEKGNYSTAYDMAILTSYAMKNETYQRITGTKKKVVTTDFNTYAWTNKNKMLSLYKYTTGGKTGFTEIAKRTLISTATKDNLDLVIVTLNDGNDFYDHKTLYEETFSEYKEYRILKTGLFEVYNDKLYENYHLYLKDEFYYPLNEQEKDSIVLKIILNNNPKVGEVGKVEVMLGDKEIGSTKLYAKEKEKTSFNFIDWIKNLW